jgi:hypothetical protein
MSFLSSKDEGVLAALRRTGSDLTLPHVLRHYLYLSEKAVAERVARQLTGFQVEVRPGTDGSWLLLAIQQCVPSEAAVGRNRTLFERLAKENGGEYDGWEAGVRKK